MLRLLRTHEWSCCIRCIRTLPRCYHNTLNKKKEEQKDYGVIHHVNCPWPHEKRLLTLVLSLASLSQDWRSGFGDEFGRTAAIWQDLVTVTICLCALNWPRFHRYTSPPDPWNVLTNMEFVIGCAAIVAARASGRSSYEALSSEPLPLTNEGHHVSHCGLSWHSEICTQSNLRWGSLRKASPADTRCPNKL